MNSKIFAVFVLCLLLSLFLFNKPSYAQTDEVMIKDFDEDYGKVPSVPEPGYEKGWDNFWNSPDIQIEPDKVIPGITNYVTITVHNIANYDVSEVMVNLYYTYDNIGSPFPSMWSTLADSGVIDHIKMHETGKITLRWTPPWGDGEMSGNPPYFIGAVAWTRKDPQTSPWAQWDNNVAMRAVQPIVVPPHKEYRYKFDFKIGNPDEKRTGKLAFWLNRDILPPGWVIRFTKKEGAFYTFRPGYYEVVTMYVIPPSSAKPGECARLEISEVLELKGDDGRGVKMGQGMTVESTVSNLTIDGKQVELINAVINPDTLKILGVAINWSANEEIADYWYEIYSPDGKSITGPKIYFENIKFRPNETKRYLFRHPLPEYLAPGLYSYRGKIGKFPDYTSDDVYLNFFVSK